MTVLPDSQIGEGLGVAFIRKLGEGSFGQVYLARDLQTEQLYAVKAFDVTPTGLEAVQQEIELQQAVGPHPHVVQIERTRYYKKGKVMWIVMELLEGGDLESVVHKHQVDGTRMPGDVIWSYFAQTVSGLRQCHLPETRIGEDSDGRVILHRDLKEANMFLNKDKTILKIGDFGMARGLNEEEWAHSMCGTVEYMAPEILANTTLDRNYDETVDLHALGVILYRMCTLQYPFEGRDQQETIRRIQGAKPAAIPKCYSSQLRHLCNGLLSRDPNTIPNLDDLINHPGIKLGLKMVQLHELETQLGQQTEENEQLKTLRMRKEERCDSLEAKMVALNVKLDKKSAEYKKTQSILMEQVKSLHIQLREERQATVARSADLDAKSQRLQLREEECAQRQIVLDKDQFLLTAQQKTLEMEQIAHRELQLRLEEQVENLAQQQIQAHARAVQQDETQRNIDAQLRVVKEREQKVAALETRQTRAFHSSDVAVAQNEQLKISAAPVSRTGRRTALGSTSFGAATKEVAGSQTALGPTKTVRPRVAVQHKDSKPIPKSSKPVCGSAQVSSSAPPGRAGYPRRMVPAKAPSASTANAHKDVRSNASRAATESKIMPERLRMIPSKTAQPSVAPARIPRKVSEAAPKVAERQPANQDTQSCEAASTSQRKIRSAPDFDKTGKAQSSAISNAQRCKWSAEDLGQKAGRSKAPTATQTAPPRVHIGAAKTSTGTAVAPSKAAAPDSNQHGPSRVPISKRLQRQFGGRTVPAFR